MGIEIKNVSFKELNNILTVNDSMSKSVEALYKGKEDSSDYAWGVYDSETLLLGFSYSINPLIPFLIGTSFVINQESFVRTLKNHEEIRNKIEEFKFKAIQEYDVFGTLNCCPVRLFKLYNRLSGKKYLNLHKIGELKKDIYPRGFFKKILLGKTKHDSDLIFFIESLK